MAYDDESNRADTLLAIRCLLGEPEAFEALARRWAAPLFRYLRGWARDTDEADELVQDVWLRVLRGLPGLRDPYRFRQWLFGIAHRTAMDRLRWRQRTPQTRNMEDADHLAAIDEREANADRETILHALERALDQLSLIERQTLTLFYFEEIPIAEIAQIQNVPVGTVKSRLFRGRAQLRTLMERLER